MKGFVLSAVIFLSLAGLAFATPQSQESQPAKAKTHAGKSNNNNTQATGEDVFNAHCARCHTPPSAIRPRITGSVIMHMRVRARLSRQDEQLLLKYMAP